MIDDTPEAAERRARMAQAFRQQLIADGSIRPGGGEYVSPLAAPVIIAMPLDDRAHAEAARIIHATERGRAAWLREHGAEPLRSELRRLHETGAPSNELRSEPTFRPRGLGATPPAPKRHKRTPRYHIGGASGGFARAQQAGVVG